MELGSVPDEIEKKIRKESDLETLGSWVKLAAKSESMDSFLAKMNH